jgi:hypothetical protein
MVANVCACWADIAQLAPIYVRQAGHGKGAIRGANLDDQRVQNRTLASFGLLYGIIFEPVGLHGPTHAMANGRVTWWLDSWRTVKNSCKGVLYELAVALKPLAERLRGANF